MKKILILILVGVLFPVLALAQIFYVGNPSCCDLGYCENQFKPNTTTGSYNDGVLFVEIVLEIDEKFLDWTSNIPVDGVIAGTEPALEAGVNFYEYDPASTGGRNYAPDPHPIRQITFCYSVEEPPPTAKFIPLPDDFRTQILAKVGELFLDLSPFVASIGIGLPLSFWAVRKVISLARK